MQHVATAQKNTMCEMSLSILVIGRTRHRAAVAVAFFATAFLKRTLCLSLTAELTALVH